MRLVALFGVALFFVSAYARAQPCPTNDALSAARRARYALESVRRANEIVDTDVFSVAELERLAPPEARPEWSVYGAGLIDGTTLSDIPVCTSAGARKGELTQFQWAAVTGARHERSGLELRLHLHEVRGALYGSSDEDANRASAIASQTVLGASLGFRRWVRLQLVSVEPLRARRRADEAGVSLVDPAQSAAGRVGVGVGIPALSLSALGLANTQSGDIDVAQVGITRLPVGTTRFLATATKQLIADEKQWVDLVGVTYSVTDSATVLRDPVDDAKHDDEAAAGAGPTQPRASDAANEIFRREQGAAELTTETSIERGGLRHVRMRGDAAGAKHLLFVGKKRDGTPTAAGGYARFGLYGEVTWFGSKYFARQTGRSGIMGAGGGFYAQVGTRYLSIRADGYGGINRPETLARLSTAATAGEARAMFYLKAGL